MFQSKYKVCKDLMLIIESIQNRFNINISDQYISFLKKINVVVLDSNYYIESKNQKFISLDIILGVSKIEDEDLVYVNDFYEDRVPRGYLVIAKVNDSDLLCLSDDGSIYLWDHEINDLYFNMNDINTYLPQSKKLFKISDSFNQLYSMISIDNREENDSDIQDEIDKPFPDDALDLYFKNNKLFFMTSPEVLATDLKRLELSEKGKKLIDIFMVNGLIK